MKLKGINPLEQHVEKIVLGLVALVFVGVLAVQFLVSPNSVDYDGQPIPPDQVLTRLGDKAKGVLASMNDPDPTLPPVETPDLLASYEAKLADAGFGGTRVAATPYGERFDLAVSEVEGLDGPVTPLRLPLPDQPMAVSQWTTVDPFFARSNPSMDRYLPEVQPMDKVSVTVEAKVNGELIREVLESADEGKRSIPSHWWSEGGEGLIEVLTVEAERQKQNPDGSWSAAEPVESVRWTPTLLEAFNEGVNTDETLDWDDFRAADLINLAMLAKDDPSLVSQPSFLPSIAGVEWVPPSKVEQRQARLDLEAKIGRVEREIQDLNEEIAQIQDRMAANQQRQSQDPDPGGRSGGGGGGGGFTIGGGGPSTSRSRANRPDPMQQRIESKREDIAEKNAELDSLFEQLADLGGDADPQRPGTPRRPGTQSGGQAGRPGGNPLILGGDPDPSRSRSTRGTRVSRASAVESPGPLLSLDEYSVWIHDLNTEPGAVYRYRVRYGVNNPLFKRSVGSEDPEMQAIAEEPIVESDWSAWTDPVSVGRTSYFFVTNARDQGQLGQSAASATAEVYRMFYGYYRKHTLSLEPGDAVQGEFRLPDDLPLFDVREASADEVLAYFDEREAENDPAGTRRTTQTAGIVLGAGNTPDPDEDEDGEEIERDWLTLVQPRYPLAVDAVMLDVAEYPVVESASLEGSRARRVLEVLFFDPISGVVARRPDRDREMPEYAAVQQSAGLAESAELRRPDPEYLP